MSDVRVYPDSEQLAHAAVLLFVDIAQKAIEVQGRFSVALSGGSTPKALYALLATDEFASLVKWSHVHLFWGDERCVPPDDPDSNYLMTREALLEHVPLPSHNIYRIHGELLPEQAAADYERKLRAFFGDVPTPRFDLIWLGMGDDGHTASLFPHTDALHEQTKWVVENYVASKHAWRITLTSPAINAAANVAFLMSGESKADRLRQVLKGDYQPNELPAQIVKPTNGNLLWLIDSKAAALL